MGVFELLSLSAVLILALYGCACLITCVSRLLLRPREPCLRLQLSVKGKLQNIEQQLRFAVFVAKESSLPLIVEIENADDEMLQIFRKYIRQNEIVINEENACEESKRCV